MGHDGTVHLNQRAIQRCRDVVIRATPLRVSVVRDESGARVLDCGVHVRGGLAAGQALAEICLGGLGTVQIGGETPGLGSDVAVTVYTDQPVAACMASQYAGWQLAADRFFAMGSGPMRAARGREPLFEKIGFVEQPASVIGCLESDRLPPADVCHQIAEQCGVRPDDVTLLVAPTTSLAGTVQVVARSVETALHKLFELDYDLDRIVTGFGQAPLPPPAPDTIQAIGRTNDAVLYGSRVTLWIDDQDDRLAELGPNVPSAASPDYGQPFADIFARYDGDFYKIDPLLFSPAEITFINVVSGRVLRFGDVRPDLLHRSFGDG